MEFMKSRHIYMLYAFKELTETLINEIQKVLKNELENFVFQFISMQFSSAFCYQSFCIFITNTIQFFLFNFKFYKIVFFCVGKLNADFFICFGFYSQINRPRNEILK